MEKVFYILHDDRAEALATMSRYINEIDVLIAQSYRINQSGQISGTVDEDTLSFAKKHHITLLAMVTNVSFDPKTTHIFLSDTEAQTNALNALIDECKKNQLQGIQFDFEMMPVTEKSALTSFYEKAADILHKNGLIVSFAIAPKVQDDHFNSSYQKKLYEVWQGVYDFEKLGAISDFVTVMAYDQHAKGTTPGPIAGIPWDRQVIEYAMTHIPKDKISLGVPTYSGLWYLSADTHSERITVHYNSLDFKTLNYIITKYKPSIEWDNVNKVNYTFYEYNGINRFIFIENAKSFEAKYALAIENQLRGVSVFRVGIEDPEIWPMMQEKPWWHFW